MSICKTTVLLLVLTLFISCQKTPKSYHEKSVDVLKDSILLISEKYVLEKPITVTNGICDRSSGDAHDFYSEGDYWWPDPQNPEEKYIRKDGMTNPNNFINHRLALIRFSEIVGNLTSAYILTQDENYAKVVIAHCKAWFVNDDTKMNPHLLYAQAIQGRYTGRGIGIIDGIHFMEVAQALIVLEENNVIDENDLFEIKKWFNEFTGWLTTHQYGIDEMKAKNNHGTCWNMQVGLYAVLTKNDSVIEFCRNNYKNTLLPNQIGEDGSFPLETKRTKPYGYSLFNLDAMVMNCLILSDAENDLWGYKTKKGLSVLNGLEFLSPYVKDKSTWPFPPDVMYWDNWPVAHPAFLFGAIEFDRNDFFELWENNEHILEVLEVKRNLPIRNPLIWIQ